MYLLDTNVISELRKVGRGADARVSAWAHALSPEVLYISAITLMEIEIGVRKIERRDQAQGVVLRGWLETQVSSAFEGRILSFDASAARVCAGLHVPDRKSERDAMIAATALVHGLCVVTRNVSDFAVWGLPLLNPWQ